MVGITRSKVILFFVIIIYIDCLWDIVIFAFFQINFKVSSCGVVPSNWSGALACLEILNYGRFSSYNYFWTGR
jgi:hypothetical protein